MRVSNTQRSLYLQCARKYKYRYVHKMRSKEKGSALFFGSAFDTASDVLFHERDLDKAKEKFTDLWMAHEDNLNCKFSKTDLDIRLLTSDDLSKIEAISDNLNTSKAKKQFDQDQDVLALIKSIKSMKDQSFMRDLTLEEERFIHYVHMIGMLRKGFLMMESFHKNILPHITEVISSQMKVDVKNPDGDTIIGYIDLLCRMEGYKLPNGRILTKDDIVVADVKTAGVTYWAKLDNLDNSDQLDTYLASPQVQEIAPTNLIAYMAVAKQISKDEKSFCSQCNHEKTSSHRTCNNEIDGKRCGGSWDEDITYFSDAKIVIGERDLNEASQVYNDYDDIVHAIKAQVFPRNRESCEAYGQICEFKYICGKCLTPEQEEAEIEKWKTKYGE